MQAEKNGDKDGKALYKLMINSVFWKTMENLRSRINIKLVSNKKDYSKWAFWPNSMSHKIFHNDLVAIRKNEITLRFNKPAYIWMYMLELSKLLI